MAFDSFNFDFNVDVMKKDLNRVDKQPGQSNSEYFEKYVIMPKSEGAITCRILPADTPRGRIVPYASTRLHYHNKRSYHCLRELVDGKWQGNCPLCNYYYALYDKAKAAKTNDEADAIKLMARDFKPIERYYYNVIVRRWIHPDTGEVKLNYGPLILSVGKSLHGKILRAFLGNEKFQEPPIGNIAHPLTGRDFKIIKQISRGDGGKEYPNYDASRFEPESVLGDEKEIQLWLSKLWDLEAERGDNVKSVDELQDVVDVIQGKKPDPSVGFDSNQYSLPASFEDDDNTDDHFPAYNETKKDTEGKGSPSVTSSVSSSDDDDDSSFSIDLDDPGIGDPAWMSDLQNAMDEA